METSVGALYEKNLSKLLSEYLARDLNVNREQNPHISLLDKIFDLAKKWKPPFDKLRNSIRSLGEVIQLDEIPLSYQFFFLQSLANLEYLHPSSSNRASKMLLESLNDLRLKGCWSKSFSSCMVRSFLKQLDFLEEGIVTKLSDVNDILKRSLAESVGLKDHELYRAVCVTTLTDLVITWCKQLPKTISYIEAPSGPSRALTPIYGVLEATPISSFLRWTAAECLRRMVTTNSLWNAVSQGQVNSFLNLCIKSVNNFRADRIDPITLTLVIGALTNGAPFLNALENPEYICELISNMLLILQPLFVSIKDDTRLYEARFTCLRFIGRFVCEFIPPIDEAEPTSPLGESFGAPSLKNMDDYAKKFHSLCAGFPEQEAALHAEVQDAYALYISDLGLGQEEAPRILYPKILD